MDNTNSNILPENTVNQVVESMPTGNDLLVEISSKLDDIAKTLATSARKDEIIASLHSDLTQQHTDVVTDLRRPLINAVIKIFSRLSDIQTDAHSSEIADRPDAFLVLGNQIDIAVDFVEDILNDDLDVEIIRPKDGDLYDRRLFASIETVHTDSPELDKHVARCLQPGFVSRQNGAVVRQATVVTYTIK